MNALHHRRRALDNGKTYSPVKRDEITISNVDVFVWCATPRPVVPTDRVRRGYLSPTLIGFVGTVLIHALLVPSAYLGSRGGKARPPQTQEPGSLVRSKGGLTESLVLITLPTTSGSSNTIARDVSIQFGLSKKAMISRVDHDLAALLDQEILALGEELPATAPGDGGEAAEQARLFGIYSGQIRARVERIWRRPRTPVNESGNGEPSSVASESFQCQVQIVQDTIGVVKEVLLPQCNGSPVWQRSLVMAIQQASPLPAPPSTRVFSQSVVLLFVGLPYVSGAADEDYEMEDHRSARAIAPIGRSMVTEFNEFRAKARPDGLASAPNNPDPQN